MTRPDPSTEDADRLIAWLREYADARLDVRLIDERRTIPPHVILDFGNAGLFGLEVAREYGGLALSRRSAARVYAQLGAIDLTLATQVSSHAIGASVIERHGSEALRRRWLPVLASGRALCAFALTEPGAGSNPQAIVCTAEQEPSGQWCLRGEKTLVDSATWASVYVVFARTRVHATGAWAMSCFAVPRSSAGLRVGHEQLTHGMRAMVQCPVVLDGVRVDADALVGQRAAGTIVAQQALAAARLMLSAKSVGATKRCLQLAHRFAQRRPVATGLLADNPVTRSRLTRLAGELHAVGRLVDVLAARLDDGHEVPHEAFLSCKVAATEMLWRTVHETSLLLGARGYEERNLFPQMLRDARSFLLSEGPSEPLLSYAGEACAGGRASSTWSLIADALGSREIADELLDACHALAVRCNGVPALDGTWATYCMGRLAMHAMLAAAAASASDAQAPSFAPWASLAWSEVRRAVLEGGIERWAVTADRGIAQWIDAFARDIGDITHAACATPMDPLLRPATIAGAASPAAEPVARGEDGVWNRAVPALLSHASVAEAFERQALRTPERVAVSCEHTRYTYRALDDAANRLADRLATLGVGPGTRVAVCHERRCELVVAMLAVLKREAAFVPVDPTHPPRRVERILRGCDIRHVIGTPEATAALPLDGAHRIAPDDATADDATADELRVAACRDAAGCTHDVATHAATAHMGDRGRAAPAADSSAIAYVMHTSGSTGEPKAVLIGQRALLNLLGAMIEAPGIATADRWLAITPSTFDISVLELLGPLMAGAEVVIATTHDTVDPGRLACLIERVSPTIMQATPATWQMLLDDGWRGASGLVALCGGDTLNAQLARRLRACVRRLWNLYGPTETTIWSCAAEIVADDGPVTIGTPIAGTGVYLRDADGAPVAPGEAGELCIAGTGLAIGYRGQAALTSERFVHDAGVPGARLYRTGDLARQLPDGRFVHLGRLDHQVKIRGYRIETGEIESVLRRHASVADAVVDALRVAADDVRLVAFVRTAPGAALDKPALRAHLASDVPVAMVPSDFIECERFPLTAHGKLDRKALLRDAATALARPVAAQSTAVPTGSCAPGAAAAAAAGVPGASAGAVAHATTVTGSVPPDAVEDELARIWCALLNVHACARDADFFLSGGHSLLAAQLLARVRSRFGVALPLSAMLATPTIAGLARTLRESRQVASQPPEDPVREMREAVRATNLGHVASSGQQRFWFLEQLDAGGSRYNTPWGVALDGALDAVRLRGALDVVAARQEVLRATFRFGEHGPVYDVSPDAGLALPLVDVSHLRAAHADDEVRRAWRALIAAPIDLERGPLLRATLFRLAPERHLLVGVVHHIVSDAWSVELLLRELAGAYAQDTLAAPLPYHAYAAWEQKRLAGDRLAASLSYWKQALGDVPMLHLPSPAAPRHETPSEAGQVRFSIDAPTMAALGAAARNEEATVFMALMACWQTYLAHSCEQDAFAVGYASTERRYQALESTLGCFVNTVAMRADLRGARGVRDVLRNVRREILEAEPHAWVPFERVVRALALKRRASENPLFQTMLDIQQTPPTVSAIGTARVTRLVAPATAPKMDVIVALHPNADGLSGCLEYDARRVDGAWAREAARGYAELLRAFAERPQLERADFATLVA